MTPEEIKKIAEEVAHLRAFDGGYFPHEKEIREDYEVFLQWLSERYYLVEKGKADQEMINANQNIEIYKLYPKVIYVNEGVKRVLTKLFGPDIRKEEEDA